MAVFFEFWAHVLRHPELRARFLELHSRARRPLVRATQEWRPDLDAERWTTTMFALVTGANLEQLTDPALRRRRRGRGRHRATGGLRWTSET